MNGGYVMLDIEIPVIPGTINDADFVKRFRNAVSSNKPVVARIRSPRFTIAEGLDLDIDIVTNLTTLKIKGVSSYLAGVTFDAATSNILFVTVEDSDNDACNVSIMIKE